MIASSVSPLLLLLLLACPLMMVFMMRGMGHGQSHGGQSGHGSDLQGGEHGSGGDATDERPSLEELRARLDDLEAQISAREDEEAERLAAVR